MDDTSDIAKPDVSPRKQSRAARRQQLIEATIDTIAAQGYARTTLTDVARQYYTHACSPSEMGYYLSHLYYK